MKTFENIVIRLDEFTSRQGIVSAEWCKLLDATENEFKEYESKLESAKADARNTEALLMEMKRDLDELTLPLTKDLNLDDIAECFKEIRLKHGLEG